MFTFFGFGVEVDKVEQAFFQTMTATHTHTHTRETDTHKGNRQTYTHTKEINANVKMDNGDNSYFVKKVILDMFLFLGTELKQRGNGSYQL